MNPLGEWAAAFLRRYEEEAAQEDDARPDATAKYPGVTPAARALLASVDAGGVPAFMTSGLLRIAADNGIAVAKDATPNAVVEALRIKAQEPPA